MTVYHIDPGRDYLWLGGVPYSSEMGYMIRAQTAQEWAAQFT